MARLLSILVLAVMVVAVYDVWKREYNMEKRLLWTVVIVVLPVVGALAWLAVSRGYIKL